jgi:hypothetical protein
MTDSPTLADISLLIGCSMSLNTEAGDFTVDRGAIHGETFFLSFGMILAWFNILKYFEWNIKVGGALLLTSTHCVIRRSSTCSSSPFARRLQRRYWHNAVAPLLNAHSCVSSSRPCPCSSRTRCSAPSSSLTSATSYVLR